LFLNPLLTISELVSISKKECFFKQVHNDDFSIN